MLSCLAELADLNAGYIGDYEGDNYRGYWGDARIS